MALLFQPSPIPFVPHEPSWRQPLFLHYRPLMRVLGPALGALSGKVLDVGCGMQPYRPLLGPNVSEYVGLDREGPLSNPTVIGTADALPFEDNTFDAVVSTQVFEHVGDPALAVRECARVLRAGGSLVLTVPGVWPAHEIPHDYWRFTRYGVRQLLEASGLSLASVEAAGGFWSSVGQLLNLELQRGLFARDLVPLVNLAAQWLDDRGTAVEELGLAWVAVATKRNG